MENDKTAANSSIIGKEEDHDYDREEELENMENINIAGIGEDDQEEEDQKIDKFFELIRSFREARDRRRIELAAAAAAANYNNNKKKRKCIDNEESGWVPTFQWEDFMQPIPLGGRINCNNVIFNKEEEDGESGLDLKLTL